MYDDDENEVPKAFAIAFVSSFLGAAAGMLTAVIFTL